jgi:hypothetical protein
MGPKYIQQPMNPKKVLEIIRLKDQKNMRWRQIGAHMGMSHQGPYLLYKRWHEWAYSEGGKSWK